MTTLIVRDVETLEALPKIVAETKYDNVNFYRNILADNLDASQLDNLLQRIFPHVVSAIEADNVFSDERAAAKLSALDFHTTVLRNGFDEEEDLTRFVKPKGSTVPFDWNYLDHYAATGKLSDLDAYRVYNRVLGGSLDVPDWLVGKIDGEVRNWIELMSGTAKAAFALSHSMPHLNHVLVDLDPVSFDFNHSYPWRDGTNIKRIVGDVTEASTYRTIRDTVPYEGSVNFIGKQSICYFNYATIYDMLDMLTRTAQYTILEKTILTYDPSLYDNETDLTTEMASKLELDICLLPTIKTNPITARTDFSLCVRNDDEEPRMLFDYSWWLSPPTIIYGISQMLNLDVKWFDMFREEWRPVDELTNDDVDHENLNYLMFERKR